MSLLAKDNPPNPTPEKRVPSYVLRRRNSYSIKPISHNLKIDNHTQTSSSESYGKANPAVELIRRKLDELYAREPSAKQEV